MAELKTKPTKKSVTEFINSVEDPDKRSECKELLNIFKSATGKKPILWSNFTIGFGTYKYASERSSQKGEWMMTGFSPRKQNLTIYIMAGFENYKDLLQDLGKFKLSGGSCIYINHLNDIDRKILTKLIRKSASDFRKRVKVN